jgi:two-component system NtrC family sensor kinase
MARHLLRTVPDMVDDTPRSAPRPRSRWGRGHLVLCMFLAIGTVTGLAWWDSRRESEAILRDVGREQATVAAIVALGLRTHLEDAERDAFLVAQRGPSASEGRYARTTVRAPESPRVPESDPAAIVLSVLVDRRIVDLTLHAADLLGSAAPIARPGELRVLVAPPNEMGLYALDAGVLSSPPIRDALDRNQPTARLSREQAAEVGLVARRAMAGIAYVDSRVLGRWGVVSVGTAAKQRDRETRAFWRLVLGVTMATGLVLLFGGIALGNQRKELEAQRQLAISEIQRERDERLAQAAHIATMGTFAMGVVHEVSTPLGVIVGRAEQVRARAGQDERSKNAAQSILAQVDRISGVIRRFLDMARGGAPSLARANPADLIRSAANAVEHRFAKAHVSLSTDAPDEPREILCDRSLLEQALVNLLLNACDACPSGGHVQISTLSDAEKVAFVVTDDGVGIAPDVAERAKEPFFTTKPLGAGTGLGLAIATEIAKSHRGDLTLASNGERGTRALIEIPVAERVSR